MIQVSLKIPKPIQLNGVDVIRIGIKPNAPDPTRSAKTRGFTINALYWDLRKKRLLDPLESGMADLLDCQLKPPVFPFADSFVKHPLNIARVLRFKVELSTFSAP
eukprot:Gregarina_sp_Poly_1__5530@NODE_291_length_9945_cov_44_133124_g252_i0_p11_GENE_NODE_291_length_9945_cov_44_133124_g252_i0NODE_291_length_9945_cov_44_133124_g252_i0_p11_ORF_typecomplete_len105_score5_42PolyA_pol/PF01743_20/6_4e06_NODE_291_length_9945_cov_44_133124_g252_i057506064